MELPTYVTFDCYDTLVDFDIDAATLRALGPRAEGVNVDAFLREFEEIRYQEILGAYRPYREVLRRSLAQTMRRFGLPYRDADGAAIVAAVPGFGPFPEVPPALERIRRHCKLTIISNTDDDLIAGNLRAVGVPFDRVITAEQARAYKTVAGHLPPRLARAGLRRRRHPPGGAGLPLRHRPRARPGLGARVDQSVRPSGRPELWAVSRTARPVGATRADRHLTMVRQGIGGTRSAPRAGGPG